MNNIISFFILTSCVFGYTEKDLITLLGDKKVALHFNIRTVEEPLLPVPQQLRFTEI